MGDDCDKALLAGPVASAEPGGGQPGRIERVSGAGGPAGVGQQVGERCGLGGGQLAGH